MTETKKKRENYSAKNTKRNECEKRTKTNKTKKNYDDKAWNENEQIAAQFTHSQKLQWQNVF